MVRKALRRGKRRWVIDIVFRKPDGSKRRYRHDAEVQTKEGAHAEDRRRLAALAATGSPFEIVDPAAREQVAPAPAAATLREVTELYFEHYAPSHLKRSSIDRYASLMGFEARGDRQRRPATRRRRVNVLSTYGDRSIIEIDAALVRGMDAQFVRAGLGRAHRRGILAALRSIVCRYAVEAGFLAEAPRLPKLPKKVATILCTLSSEEVNRLLIASYKRHRLVFMLAAFTGLRSGELRALRVCDVDLVEGHIVVRQNIWRGVRDTPKSGHQRKIPLVAMLRDALVVEIHGRDANAPVLLSRRGKAWSENALLKAFKATARRAGLSPKWRFHDLRHFFVTELFRAGNGAPTVKELAGHADLATTQRYAHVVEVDLRTAITRLESSSACGNSPVTGRKGRKAA